MSNFVHGYPPPFVFEPTLCSEPGETWKNDPSEVTCPRCKELLSNLEAQLVRFAEHTVLVVAAAREPTCYKLVNGQVVEAEDVADYEAWALTHTSVVAKDDVDGVEVSTVFLGRDWSFGRAAKPLVFETVVSGGSVDPPPERYATLEDARTGHATTLEHVRAFMTLRSRQ